MEKYLRIAILGLVFFILLLVVKESYSAQCRCGKPISQRVIGGKEANVQDYPWLLAMHVWFGNQWNYQCVAALIHPQWAITASHCLERPLGNGFVYGSRCFNAYYQNVPCFINPASIQLALASTQGTKLEFKVLQAIPHPWFIHGQFVYDIALLQLAQPVQCGLSISLICVTEGLRMDYPNKPVTLAGWGRTQAFVAEKSERLRETQLQVLPQKQCPASNFIPGILCTLGKDFGGTPCMGDSGGPLMYHENEDNLYYVTGVVSHGTRSCLITGRIMFTSVTPYLAWIQQYVPLNEVAKNIERVPLAR